MTGKKKLPIGIEIFEKIEKKNSIMWIKRDDRTSDTEQE